MTEMHTESYADGVPEQGQPDLTEFEAAANEDARFKDALQVEDLLEEGPSFEEMVTFGIQELFQRQITLEGVMIDVITIVADNADSPFTTADKLRALLLTDEEPAAPESQIGPPSESADPGGM